MIHQYSVFDKVQDVVEVRQVPDVYNLPSGEIEKKKKRKIGDHNISVYQYFSTSPVFFREDQESTVDSSLLPDEVDMVVEASTQTPGWHLVQPEDGLVWVRDPGKATVNPR